MAKQDYMTVALLRQFLEEFKTDVLDQYQVAIASDEEGNEILPMLSNPELCCQIDLERRRIILFPSHRLGGSE